MTLAHSQWNIALTYNSVVFIDVIIILFVEGNQLMLLAVLSSPSVVQMLLNARLPLSGSTILIVMHQHYYCVNLNLVIIVNFTFSCYRESSVYVRQKFGL